MKRLNEKELMAVDGGFTITAGLVIKCLAGAGAGSGAGLYVGRRLNPNN
ncbi:class IIb bacteriocin, lactobin A/cerein 7B family [Halonatronum saccharophilum]|nr:class IIb bacteriocin, lactobin A/cerein 7B family [Halonatronum saccharophilum]